MEVCFLPPLFDLRSFKVSKSRLEPMSPPFLDTMYVFFLNLMLNRKAPGPPARQSEVWENDKMSKQVQSSSSSAFCFNPVPKKSETMKEKIRIFNSTRPEIRREHLSACDDKTEIKTGLVSEIVASFSMIDNENTRKNQVL